MTDNDQLTALFNRMCQAWTDGDADAYGACFTDDCDYVSFDGSRAQGRRPMVDAHNKLFRGVLFGSGLVGEVESIRHLSGDVALLYGTGSVLTAWRSRPPRRRLTLNTLVAVRTSEGWRFTAIHNGRIRPLRIPEPDSFPARANRALVRASRILGVGRAQKAQRAAKTAR
ncbi:SgcJ/EcaC family oxidoreductase [Actinopolymorpha sp. B17G11]|uniref:SgcJ/EcaC family oxidoreductase n=1 Tax=Actinopolymorpha sp. B17G11 TaxID=3160861 RepID=UPI0032E4BA9D